MTVHESAVLRAAGTLIVFGLLTACTDGTRSTGITTRDIHVAHSVSGTNGRATRFANTIKYRDNGLQPARGRAGNATLEARALLGGDGVTTLDVSTGVIDASTATGTLKKVQVKPLDGNGAVLSTNNYNIGTSPTFQLGMVGRTRNSNIQVQANITGIDGSRTDVVTVTESVKLRPDITVDRIDVPAHAVTGVPISIVALVTERNGDVGARADCVLYAEGVEVDRAHGIWVDAGRSVSCVFSRIFATIGQAHLRVAAESVTPGDYDNSNNSATATTDISSAGPAPISWNAAYRADHAFEFHFINQSTYSDINGNHFEQSQTRIFHRLDSWDGNVFAVSGDLGWPVTFTFHDAIDATPLTDFASNPDTEYGYAVNEVYEDPNYGTLIRRTECRETDVTVPTVQEGLSVLTYVAHMSRCRISFPDANVPPAMSSMTFAMFTSGGDVAYYSEHFDTFTFGDGSGSTFSFVGESAYTYGTVAFGGEYSFRLEVTGPAGVSVASGRFPLVTNPTSNDTPYNCQSYSDSFSSGNFCTETTFSGIESAGLASGVGEN